MALTRSVGGVSNRVSGTPGAAGMENKMRLASPRDWNPDSDHPRDARLHGVQIAFGRIYASGAFGDFPNESLEVARQAAFALIDHAQAIRFDEADDFDFEQRLISTIAFLNTEPENDEYLRGQVELAAELLGARYDNVARAVQWELDTATKVGHA